MDTSDSHFGSTEDWDEHVARQLAEVGGHLTQALDASSVERAHGDRVEAGGGGTSDVDPHSGVVEKAEDKEKVAF